MLMSATIFSPRLGQIRSLSLFKLFQLVNFQNVSSHAKRSGLYGGDDRKESKVTKLFFCLSLSLVLKNLKQSAKLINHKKNISNSSFNL